MGAPTVVILVHGFNVSNPTNTVGKMRDHYEKFDCIVETVNYGYVPFVWTVRKVNPGVAFRLTERCLHWKDKGYRVIVASHSNGGCITHLASRLFNAKIDVAVMVNPALEKNLNPCPTARKVYVYHNKGDLPVKLGRWLNKLIPNFIDKFRPWGEMGRVGYKGTNPKVFNIDCDQYRGLHAHGHSEVFRGPCADQFLSCIADTSFTEGDP